MLNAVDSSRLTNKVRLRTCGIVIREGKLLMVHLAAPTRKEPFWSVPGGGLAFGERVFDAVEREVKEETGVSVKAIQLMYVNEFIEAPFHAVEFYVKCDYLGGEAILGTDPELPQNRQMLLATEWVNLAELKERAVNPPFLTQKLVNDLMNPVFSTEFLS